MGKVQSIFGNGSAGAISRSVDDIVISVRNGSNVDIPFGAPVFLGEDGAVPFNTESPQDFDAFLGFAVRIADKTPDTYPQGQNGDEQASAWKPGDVMEVLVRGGIVVPLAASAGQAGTSVLLENVRIRNQGNASGMYTEVVVNTRNIL